MHVLIWMLWEFCSRPGTPRVKMLSSPTTDSGKLLAILHGLVPGGANHFTNGIKVAMVSAWAVGSGQQAAAVCVCGGRSLSI